MSRNTLFTISTAVLLCLPGQYSAAADDASGAEAKLREGLRAAMLQARTLQTERDTLQAAKDESDQMVAAQKAELEKLAKDREEERLKAEHATKELNDKVDSLNLQITTLNKALDSWKAGHKKITDIANTLEAKRAMLEGEVIVLKRRVAEQQTKNEGMFKIGNEVLSRYEKFGLGDAISAREPFVGITRVKFQNLMQDYSDKLEDQKIKPEPVKSQKAKP